MLYKIGRLLQLVGLILLPVGMAGNLARPEDFGTRSILAMLAVGGGVFTAGYLLQQASKPR
jgi:hypothetical protein